MNSAMADAELACDRLGGRLRGPDRFQSPPTGWAADRDGSEPLNSTTGSKPRNRPKFADTAQRFGTLAMGAVGRRLAARFPWLRDSALYSQRHCRHQSGMVGLAGGGPALRGFSPRGGRV